MNYSLLFIDSYIMDQDRHQDIFTVLTGVEPPEEERQRTVYEAVKHRLLSKEVLAEWDELYLRLAGLLVQVLSGRDGHLKVRGEDVEIDVAALREKTQQKSKQETPMESAQQRASRVLLSRFFDYGCILSGGFSLAINMSYGRADSVLRAQLVDSTSSALEVEEWGSSLVNKYVSVECQVVQCGEAEYVVGGVQVVCPKKGCRHQEWLYFPAGDYRPQRECLKCKRWPAQNEFLYESSQMAWVKVSGQESQPLVCRLMHSLSGQLSSGQSVQLSGVVQVYPVDHSGLLQAQLNVHAIQPTPDTLPPALLSFQAPPLGLLVHSLSPSIFGHEMVKLGLLLGLFSTPPQPTCPRTNCHVLILGEPGIGKSHLLKSAGRLTRSTLVAGPSASNAGLTVSVQQEGKNKVVQAGALLQSREGVLLLDEFDKMSPGVMQCLLEAMESQRVSISKAGLVCNVDTNVTLLAVANFKQGSYQQAMGHKNISLPPAILSRFDLIFSLKDERHNDRRIGKHILSKYEKEKQRVAKGRQHTQSSQKESADLESQLLEGVERAQSQDPLSLEWMRGYLKETSHLQPRLSAEAAQCLQDYFLEINQESSSRPCVRSLQSMARVTLSLARLLRVSLATRQHALLATQLHAYVSQAGPQTGHSTQSSFSDPRLSRLLNRCGGHIGSLSVNHQTLFFVNRLQTLFLQNHSDLFPFSELVSTAKALQMQVGDFGDYVERLNYQNILLKKAPGQFQLIKK